MSASEWTASASVAVECERYAAPNLKSAMATFPARAAITTFLLSGTLIARDPLARRAKRACAALPLLPRDDDDADARARRLEERRLRRAEAHFHEPPGEGGTDGVEGTVLEGVRPRPVHLAELLLGRPEERREGAIDVPGRADAAADDGVDVGFVDPLGDHRRAELLRRLRCAR